MSLEFVRKLKYDHRYRWDAREFGGPKLWTPSEIPTALWLDSHDASTVNRTGDIVYSWADKSGNGRDAIQDSGASQPKYVSDGNGHILFDGIDDFLYVPYTAELNTPDLTVFAVFSADGKPSSYRSIFTSRDVVSSNTFGYILYAAQSNYVEAWSGSGASTWSNIQGGNVVLNEDRMITASYSTTEGSSIYSDGSFVSSNTTPYAQNGVRRLNIGSGAESGTAFFLEGKIHEIIILNSIPKESLREFIEGYLAHKWGLESKLPVGHTFKTDEPTV